jgi:hypothetical protein
MVGLGFAIAVVNVACGLGFTLPTNNIKNRGKLIYHTKQALPENSIRQVSVTTRQVNSAKKEQDLRTGGSHKINHKN